MPVAAPATENREYEARHLLVLEGLEAVRKRPAMYIGSTDTRGLMHCLWEVIDNAVDEALGGFGREIAVTLRSDGGISVHDHGRGIPVDIEPRTGLSGVEVVFTKLHAGGKFGAGSYNATGGLHGVGSCRDYRPAATAGRTNPQPVRVRTGCEWIERIRWADRYM